MLFAAGPTPFVRDMGGFVVRPNLPGWPKPWPTDHGHGPLAMVVELFLVPGRLIAMHAHCNDEIISWVPRGVMRHEDMRSGRLVVDQTHLLVMNAGSGFSHSEQTLKTDPPLRMLQILIRPRAVDLPPMVQHGALTQSAPNTWRHLCGPEGTGAPFFVRNRVDMFDIRLTSGTETAFPAASGSDIYFYVFSGLVRIRRRTLGEGHVGLILGNSNSTLTAGAAAVVVAFLIRPGAPLTRKGTVADSHDIPHPCSERQPCDFCAQGTGYLGGLSRAKTCSSCCFFKVLKIDKRFRPGDTSPSDLSSH